MQLLGGVSLAKVVEAPKHLFFAGCPVTFYIVIITYVAPRFGLGNAIFFVLLGQLLSAAVIDHFGLFNAPETRMNMLPVCGLLFMVAGVWLTQVGHHKIIQKCDSHTLLSEVNGEIGISGQRGGHHAQSGRHQRSMCHY